MVHDVAVVGAGPAGLAAATAARGRGADVVIIEQGKPLQERSAADRSDIVSGIGGAGLYSDGKFSFFPSASALWSVQPTDLLLSGYEWLAVILSAAGMPVPPFPRVPSSTGSPLPGGSRRKEYPSFYLPLGKRNDVTLKLANALTDCFRPACRITRIEQLQSDCVRLRGDNYSVLARCVILALGRLGPLTLRRSLAPAELVFRRIELGVRIEQPAGAFVLANDRCLDPKLVQDRPPWCSWRTFCCCRNGQVVVTSADGLTAVSGRADCPPTGRSSIGLLIRYTDPQTGLAAWREAQRCQPVADPAVEPLGALMDRHGRARTSSRVVRVLGMDTARHLVEGLKDLRHLTGQPLTDAVVYAPAIEGVGLYPKLDLDLRIPGRPMFVAGDATGMFRGLTAALLSGFVAGSAAAASVTRVWEGKPG